MIKNLIQKNINTYKSEEQKAFFELNKNSYLNNKK